MKFLDKKKQIFQDINDWEGKKHYQSIEKKTEGRYLSYSDVSVSDRRRRATDRRRRHLAAGALLPRLLRNRRQESVTSASRHLAHHARIITSRADTQVWERSILIDLFLR